MGTTVRSQPLLTGPVGPTLLRLAAPMVLGLAAIILFNVVDTYFVGQIGARELAAMSFTFPVTFAVMSVAMGVGMGASAVIARSIGQGDRAQMRRLTTDSILLANVLVVAVALLGLLALDPIFRAMGADADTLPLVRSYMVPWLLGIGLLMIPMVGNSAIRATGDTRTPSVIMIIAGGVNAALDPIMIFGWGPVPAMGLAGAAYASVLSWSVTFAAAFWVLTRRENMICFNRPSFCEIWHSWKQILYVGLPAVGTNLVMPVSMALVTGIVARHGDDAVAGFGVGTRLESLAMIGVTALGAAMTPFVGQNFGAQNCDRIRAAVRFAFAAAMLYGVGVALALAALAFSLSRVFNDTPAVQDEIVRYLRVVPVSYGLFGFALLMNSTFNALNKPFKSAFLVFVRLALLTVPLAWIGSRVWGTTGIFAAIAIANLAVGVVAWFMVRRLVTEAEERFDAERAVPAPS